MGNLFDSIGEHLQSFKQVVADDISDAVKTARAWNPYIYAASELTGIGKGQKFDNPGDAIRGTVNTLSNALMFVPIAAAPGAAVKTVTGAGKIAKGATLTKAGRILEKSEKLQYTAKGGKKYQLTTKGIGKTASGPLMKVPTVRKTAAYLEATAPGRNLASQGKTMMKSGASQVWNNAKKIAKSSKVAVPAGAVGIAGQVTVNKKKRKNALGLAKLGSDLFL